MNTILKTSNLNKVYKLGGFINRVKINALDDVNLTIESDEPVIISVVGESGSGKTTLAKHLCEIAGCDPKQRYLNWDASVDRENIPQGI